MSSIEQSQTACLKVGHQSRVLQQELMLNWADAGETKHSRSYTGLDFSRNEKLRQFMQPDLATL